MSKHSCHTPGFGNGRQKYCAIVQFLGWLQNILKVILWNRQEYFFTTMHISSLLLLIMIIIKSPPSHQLWPGPGQQPRGGVLGIFVGPATAAPPLLPILAEAIDPFWQGTVISAGRSQVIMCKQWKKEQARRCCTTDVCLHQSVNQLYNNKKWPNLFFFPLLDYAPALQGKYSLNKATLSYGLP